MCFIKLLDTLTGQILFVQQGDGFNVTNDPFKAKSFNVKSQETLDWLAAYEDNLYGLFPAPQWHVSFYEGDKSNDDFCTHNGTAERGAAATSRDTAVRTEEQQQSQASGHDALDDAISKR